MKKRIRWRNTYYQKSSGSFEWNLSIYTRSPSRPVFIFLNTMSLGNATLLSSMLPVDLSVHYVVFIVEKEDVSFSAQIYSCLTTKLQASSSSIFYASCGPVICQLQGRFKFINSTFWFAVSDFVLSLSFHFSFVISHNFITINSLLRIPLLS